MSEVKAAPTPWGWDTDDLGTWINLDLQGNPLSIAKLSDKSSLLNAPANAEFICQAVNSYEALLESNKRLRSALEKIQIHGTSRWEGTDNYHLDFAATIAKEALHQAQGG